MEGKHTKIMIGIEIAGVIGIIIALFMFYPRANLNVNGNIVKFDSINSKIIMFSENPDFSNPRYIDLSDKKSFTFDIKPGTYYWKSDNGMIEGFVNKFTIDSKVGLEINQSENQSNLVNVGNVKINVTKDANGIMVGHIILEPEQSEKINNSGVYAGKQES